MSDFSISRKGSVYSVGRGKNCDGKFVSTEVFKTSGEKRGGGKEGVESFRRAKVKPFCGDVGKTFAAFCAKKSLPNTSSLSGVTFSGLQRGSTVHGGSNFRMLEL